MKVIVGISQPDLRQNVVWILLKCEKVVLQCLIWHLYLELEVAHGDQAQVVIGLHYQHLVKVLLCLLKLLLVHRHYCELIEGFDVLRVLEQDFMQNLLWIFAFLDQARVQV